LDYHAQVGHRRSHYERAFEAHLRRRGIAYVSVNEARRALLPASVGARLADGAAAREGAPGTLKSFDFLVYGDGVSLIVDVKGRTIGASRGGAGDRPGRLESWATADDVASLGRWEAIFGAGFRAALVFLYRCEAEPPGALFQEVFEHEGVWYAVRAAGLRAYRERMRRRSERWGTVHVPTADFERISEPLSAMLRVGGAAAGSESLSSQSLQPPGGAVSS